MNKQHLLHIGYPKTGTTWLWDSLKQNSYLQSFEKEDYKLATGESVTDYINRYRQLGDYTLNFCPLNAFIDRYLISQLSHCENIYASIIIRNPYEILYSLYNFLGEFCHQHYNNYVTKMLTQGPWFINYTSVIQRWSERFDKSRFNVFLYDNLLNNQDTFFAEYMSWAKLTDYKMPLMSRTNVTKYQLNTNINLKQDNIDKIEKIISQIEIYMDINLLHWRMK